MHKELLKLKSSEIERLLCRHGFYLSRSKGSHRQYVGVVAGVKRRVTVIANLERFPVALLKSMIKQSGLSEEEWLQSGK
jgi:predicted RNA binding protein YcfA (HicA-like mRNA interferase family)